MQQQHPILTSDAAAMFRRKIMKNDRPFDVCNKGWNNRRVDAWKADLLDKVARDGRLQTEIVMGLWSLYVRGDEISKMVDLSAAAASPTEAFPSPCDEKELDAWREFFEAADTDALHAKGKFSVARGWSMIQGHFQAHEMREMYAKIYQGTAVPYEWYKRHLEYRDMFAEPLLPFWTLEEYRGITELVMIFLSFRVGPSR
uniref:Uncharacterized protein n=1 Tax=Marseillevirus LCMAC103 TaxID=2506604 RepID=A0A481YUC8_9VIRU|nr:MAG: uncharacterized protein LCMAC103_00480 [Marseillevirus LCMAC103]